MIRQYQSADLETVLSIWDAASLGAYPGFDGGYFNAERNRIRKEYLPSHKTWGWISNDRMVGFISHRNAFIGGLFVAPEHQGNGIGSALVKHVQRSNGLLDVDVFASNTAALLFYEKQSFAITGEYRHQPTAALILRLSQKAP